MEKTMTLGQITEFINSLIHSFTTVGVKRIVYPTFRYSDLGVNTFILQVAFVEDKQIQFCAKSGDGVFTLDLPSNTCKVEETEYAKDSYQYRFSVGDDIYILLRAEQVVDERSPLEKFTNP